MGYYWDKMVSEVGPVALAMSLLALWLLWVLSRRSVRDVDSSEDALQTLEAQRAAARLEALSQVRGRLTSAGLAILESPQLVDKSGQSVALLSMDLITVFDDALWLIRVCVIEGRASGELTEERWVIERALGGEAPEKGEESARNPTRADLRFKAVVKRLAHSKKLSQAAIRYALVYVGGELKVRSSEQVKVMSVSQLSKAVKRSAKQSAARPSASLTEARELWRVVKQRDLSQAESDDRSRAEHAREGEL